MAYQRDPRARSVPIYRWFAFLLAAFFCLRQLVFTADYSDPGGPFRFLTIWALLLTFFCASRMLAVSQRRSGHDWSRTVSVTAVVNGLVVFLYWRLWFEDPALVNDRDPLPMWVSLYLHGLGPLLQWIDAIGIGRAFRRPFGAILPFMALVALYVCWIELFVAPANEFPVGRFADGLPYPFLNDMVWADRLAFYLKTTAMGLGLLSVLTICSAGLGRLGYSSAERSAASPDRKSG